MMMFCFMVSTHSRPKAAALGIFIQLARSSLFQHTAARRRLALRVKGVRLIFWFQHTAARRRLVPRNGYFDFTVLFQHTAARRRLGMACAVYRF